MAAVEAPIRSRRSDDFETASIRSAAPSYFSDAPSYRSMLDPPPYTPRETPPYTAYPALLAPRHQRPVPQTLPSIPSLSPASRNNNNQGSSPNLSHFQVLPWPSLNSNPNVRIYNSIAQRRITRDYESAVASLGPALGPTGTRPPLLERVSETPEEQPLRPLEDPHLVGEEAASRARTARLERERLQDPLVNEDLQWDQFLSQVARDRENQERNSLYSSAADRTRQRRGGLLRRLGTLGRFM
jgi:hypothetical protein